MTENKRIVLNIVATYGRSLFALACGLFSGRWALMALGEVDFGLMGLVGGLTLFIAFFNGLLSSAVGRFYAFSVGQASVSGEEGLEECRKWFNAALLLHTVIPLILMIVGYPIGVYTIEHWLVIPPERLSACIWVFRFVCISCFVGMINVPFNAMYTAKQYIAELTIYSVISTALNVCFLYYMVSTPQEWLVKYAMWSCVVGVVPQVLIALRALKVFPECQIRFDYLWDWSRIKQLTHFAGWQVFGNMGAILRGQGVAILINKAFGARVNTSMAIANNVSGQAATLSNALAGAFAPAITNACGRGDFDKMNDLAYRACKYCTFFKLLFILPLALELPKVLELWLKTPPVYTTGLCWSILLMVVIDATTTGYLIAVTAKGRIALYQVVLGTFLILTLPVAYLFVKLGWGVYSVGWAMVLMTTCCAWGRVFFARQLIQASVRYWFFSILLPLLSISMIAAVIGYIPHLFFTPSFFRVLLTSGMTVVSLLIGAWFLLLSCEDKQFVQNYIATTLSKFTLKKS